MSVCVCMCVWLAVSTPCVSTPSVCIYCVCVYLFHLLKTLTNAPALIAPALIAPTQLLAASGRRDEALYQALGARLRTRRVRAVLCVGLVRTNRSWMIRSTCADIELAPHRLPGSAPALAHHGARRLALSQLRRGHGLAPHTTRTLW